MAKGPWTMNQEVVEEGSKNPFWRDVMISRSNP